MSSAEIRAIYKSITDDCQSDSGALITSSWISSIQASIGDNRSMSSEVVSQVFKLDSAIRIRKEDEDVMGEMSDIETFWSILEHVRVVLPSAVSFVTGGDTTNNSSTLLTLSPLVIRKLGARKVFDALNAGLKAFLPEEDFLSGVVSADSWVDSLLAATESKERSGLQIPLFAVFLYRLEHAFRDAHQASASTYVDKPTNIPQTGTSQSTASFVDASSAFSDALAASWLEFEGAEITDDQKLIVTSDLADKWGVDRRSMRLTDLVLTPLTLVSRSMETEGGGGLAAADDFIKTALERFRSFAAKDNQPPAAMKESKPAVQAATSNDSEELSRSPEQENGSPKANNAKKKKKRNKSKKKVSTSFLAFDRLQVEDFPNPFKI